MTKLLPDYYQDIHLLKTHPSTCSFQIIHILNTSKLSDNSIQELLSFLLA
jgi:hypothetical protein